MKFSFKFSSLLGTVYERGNLLFSPDGNCVYSPVGNKITAYDLKNNKSETFPFETRTNITLTAISPNGRILVLVTEDGTVFLCSLVSKTVLHRHHFTNTIHQLAFSPDGKYLSIARGSSVFTFHAPGGTVKHLNAFFIVHVMRGFHDDVTCLDWSSDSRAILAGSKDMTTKVAFIEWVENFRPYCVSGHVDAVVNCFFEQNSLNFYTVSRNGAVNVWVCSLSLEDVKVSEKRRPLRPTMTVEEEENKSDEEKNESCEDEEETVDLTSMAKYSKLQRHMARKLVQCEDGEFVTLTAAAFHKPNKIMVTGFSTGAFFLHEMPEFVLIHSLSIAQQSISSICFNDNGDWIGLASSTLGQLVVWEWQSETYILKQQGHFNNMNCLAYSPDGQHVVTGGDDGKVKVWNVHSGFCFVTFTEHSSGISGVTYIQNGKAIVSASLDGTVRCFDLNRYRNFRTFTSTQPTQFSCLAVDSSGEIICAGGKDVFEIFLWSMQTGRLLEILTGHEAPVSSLTFSKIEPVLVSGSWDKTFRVWNVYSGKGTREVVSMIADVMAVNFRPDGVELAVATLNGQLTFFDVKSTIQTGCIEGRNDLGSGRRDTDFVTAKQVQKAKSFTTLCYSADGECILAAGRSKNVCIYHVKQQVLMKKFEITQNRSLDAMDSFINKRKMTEFGNMALIEERDMEGDAVAIALPGVKKGDMASRVFKPEVSVSSIQFSPTGRCWAATTTEGLLVYSLDVEMIFDPLDLEMDVTVSSIREVLDKGDFTKAVVMALKLNEKELITGVLERIHPNDIELIVANTTDKFTERLLSVLADRLENSAHLEFYLRWIHCLLMNNGQRMKDNSGRIMPLLHHLQRAIYHKYQSLERICDHNKYLMRYLSVLAKTNESDRHTLVNSTDNEMSKNL